MPGDSVKNAPTQGGKNHVLMYIYAVFMNYVYWLCFQKLEMFKLKEVDLVGGPAGGLTVIITGPTGGIGLQTARALARRGARLVLACRNMAKGEDVKKDLEADCRKQGLQVPEIEVRKLDLSSLKSVREFAADWESTKREVHILINNAGVWNVSLGRTETEDHLETHMACNHLGHFLLTLLLVPALKRGSETMPENFGGASRVVHVGSCMHLLVPSGISPTNPHLREGNYSSETSYCQSKLAQIMFAAEMRRRLGPEPRINVFAVHPGLVMTDMVKTLPEPLMTTYRLVMNFLLLTPSQGARSSVYCATSADAPLEGLKTNGYFDATCKPILPSDAAQDEIQAKWLWRWSAEQVGLPKEMDIPEPIS